MEKEKISIDEYFIDFIIDELKKLNAYDLYINALGHQGHKFSNLKLYISQFDLRDLITCTLTYSYSKEGRGYWMAINNALNVSLYNKMENIDLSLFLPIYRVVNLPDVNRDNLRDVLKKINYNSIYYAHGHLYLSKLQYSLTKILSNVPFKDITFDELVIMFNLNFKSLHFSQELEYILESYSNQNTICRYLIQYSAFLDFGDYFDITKEGTITFLPIKKIKDIDLNDYYTASCRQSINPGRIVKKLIPTEIDLCLVEDFASYIKSFAYDNYVFKLLNADGIKESYLESNYAPKAECVSSPLHNSCMRYEQCQEYLNFYVNFDTKILVMYDDGKVVARALFWETNLGLYLDRVYYIYPTQEKKMIKYAISTLNIDYYNNSGNVCPACNSNATINNDSIFIVKNKHVLQQNEDYLFPYLDTFQSYYPTSGILSWGQIYNTHIGYDVISKQYNFPDNIHHSHFFQITCTDGDYEVYNND